MTEPGAIIPPQPGWWPRTDPIGTDVTAVYGWDSAPVGVAPYAAAGSGAYNWALVDAVGAKGIVMPTLKGSAQSSGSSVTLPTHAVGDLIVIYAYDGTLTTAPSPPSAGGTVPAWNTLDATGGSNVNDSATFWFVATATNHTSGAFGATTAMIAAVVADQSVSTPIGGHAEAGGQTTNAPSAPAVTLAQTDNSSLILHFLATRNPVSAWSTPPAGYTQQVSNSSVSLITKDTSTADGSVTQTFTPTGSNIGYRGATIEIRNH